MALRLFDRLTSCTRTLYYRKLYFLQDELEALKNKVEKLENERTVLKHENDKLEAKVRNFLVFYKLLHKLLQAPFRSKIEQI